MSVLKTSLCIENIEIIILYRNGEKFQVHTINIFRITSKQLIKFEIGILREHPIW